MGIAREEASRQIVIDEGFRRWYAACPCCLGENYPEVRAALDRERADRPAPGARSSPERDG